MSPSLKFLKPCLACLTCLEGFASVDWMKVLNYVRQRVGERGALLSVLIDPDKLSFGRGAAIAAMAERADADLILVGGSVGAQGDVLDGTIRAIKESCSLPVVLFPGSIAGLSAVADALYFMQLLNSRDVYWSTMAQIQAAPVVARLGIEVIPTSYVVVEPGEAVGWVGNANLLPRSRSDLAAACALAARFLGAQAFLIDCGSGSPLPPPTALVAAIARVKGDLFFSVGGGVRNPSIAAQIVRAGAEDIRIGAAFEGSAAVERRMRAMAKAIHSAGAARLR